MAKKYNEIEDLFNEEFQNIEIQPSPQVWTNLNKRLWLKQFFRLSLNAFNLYYLLALIGSASAAGIFIHNSFENKPLPIASEVTQTKPVENKNIVTAIQDTISVNEDVVIEKTEAKAAFTINESVGCAPLNITFSNKSLGADAYLWDFGDGNTSNAFNPAHEYTKPGNYTAKLIITDGNGKKISHEENIIVNKAFNPEIDFDITKSDYNSKTICFTSNCPVDGSFEWNFANQGSSSDASPTFAFGELQTYEISLTYTNSNNCPATITKSFDYLKDECFIEFPMIFKPKSKAISGNYQTNGENSAIFHPNFKGVTNYQLSIYNPMGQKIFESNQLNIGWNGFYRNAVSPSGSYKWVSKGEFANGTSFSKEGVVQLIAPQKLQYDQY